MIERVLSENPGDTSERGRNGLFLAPLGAQEMQMFVRLSDENLSGSLNLHLCGSALYEVTLRLLSYVSPKSILNTP